MANPLDVNEEENLNIEIIKAFFLTEEIWSKYNRFQFKLGFEIFSRSISRILKIINIEGIINKDNNTNTLKYPNFTVKKTPNVTAKKLPNLWTLRQNPIYFP